MPPDSDPLLPTLTDQYEIARELGRGGMATVYLARERKHGRQVAIKVLRSEGLNAASQERFQREVAIAARLSHPHIVALFDSGVAGGHLYYVMPYIQGESLRDRLAREGQLPLEEALRIAREILGALAYAHRHELVHRDIKPDNVLLADGIAMVADFGIARAAAGGGAAGMTTVGTIIGTPAYMAPEQAAGSAEVDARADLYSVACVLYEMLAGVPPFIGPAESLLHQHLQVAPRPVTDIRPSVPAAVTAAIAKSLSKTPADRHVTATQFAEALATALAASVTPTPGSSSGSAVAHSLPAERTHFIGRERELVECARLLADARLLTLTGVGGCGKTRLALRLARTVLDRYPDGVAFVDLGPLGESAHVIEAVAGALEVKEVARESMRETLRKHVTDKRLLIVLDNCEHLLTACAELVDLLLSAGGDVHVLATSREGLGVEGERLYALRSLAVPPEAGAADPEVVGASEAVRLFVDRARAVAPGFDVTRENAPHLAEICRQLDGIPLAIELAAARVKILSVDQIRDRLSDRFRLLTGGSRTALPRHQTLRAAIQWSYDQLLEDERRLFRRLSVFSGGWTLAAATHVSGDAADEFEVMDLLARLVDKSLIVVARDSGATRYHLLETVRQYAHERLHEAGEADAARHQHLEHFLALADQAYTERFERDEHWCAVLEAEHDNLRAALAFARGVDVERYLGLAGALGWFWQVRSHLIEGTEHLKAALAAAPSEPARATRARALWALAHALAWQGDNAAAHAGMQDALAIWRKLGDFGEVAIALEGIGWVQMLGGDDLAVRATFEECLRLQRERGDPVHVNRAAVALAQVLVALHEVELARPMATEIITFSKSRGDRRNEHFGWHFLADCSLIEGRYSESLALYRDALRLALTLGDRMETSFEVQGVAMSLAGLGESERAVRLAGAVHAEYVRLGVDPHMRFWDELIEKHIGTARAALGTSDVWERGRAMPFDRAVQEALAGGEQETGIRSKS